MKRKVPEGVRVKFRHVRLQDDAVVLPRGGLTLCFVTLPDGAELLGRAECSERDNYCKKIGRDIALGRALKNAESKFPELFKAKEMA